MRGRTERSLFGCVVLLASSVVSAYAQEPPSPAARVAVVVGANAPPEGRRPLRYAHGDARGIARVLERTGGFARSNIHLLLDPSAQTVIRVLDAELERLRALEDATMLLFYYSGHADENGLFPGGQPLSYADLRRRLESDAARVRVGIVDACRGGGWTGTRGLTEAEAFEVNVPLDVSNEGSVLVASSSGLEDAHESEALQGGFFTHHWVAALQGAGDRNGDRFVTVVEAFDYAKSLTIRDTARHAEVPQHPSFRVNLSGRRDLPLAELERTTTTLTIHQQAGPLQLVDLGTGLVALELPAGERRAELALDAGRYLVRGRDGETIRASEVRVIADRPSEVREADLQTVDEVYLAARGVGGRTLPSNLSTLPAGTTQLQLGLGVARNDSVVVTPGGSEAMKAPVGRLVAAYGITDRWQLILPLPAIAFRSSVGPWDFLPWAGLHESRFADASTSPGFGFIGEYVDRSQFAAFDAFALSAALGAGVDVAHRFAPDHRLLMGAALRSPFLWVVGVVDDLIWRSDDLALGVFLGDSFTIADRVTISIALQYEQRLIASQPLPSLRLGSVQGFGVRPIPLVRVHLNDHVAIDGHVALTYDFFEEGLEETYMIGSTVLW